MDGVTSNFWGMGTNFALFICPHIVDILEGISQVKSFLVK